ncbi:305_t:CDS:2, partial [Rhizophagus irregularis]
GWIGALFPYRESGFQITKNEIVSDEMPSGLMHVPFSLSIRDEIFKLSISAEAPNATQRREKAQLALKRTILVDTGSLADRLPNEYKQAANSEYKTRLKQAIESLECVPSSKTLLKLEKKLDLGRYKNNWTRYDDWKENRKANMDMKTDDESGQDNGDDDNLFHLSPEHTRHTQRSMNEKPTIMSLRFWIATNSGRGKSRHLLRPTVNFGIIVATLKDTQLRKLHDAIIGGVQVHKDFAVVVAEAAHALSRILSIHTFSETKISLIRVHFALVNNFHIYVLCFELQSGCIGADIENVLNLIVYLRQIDCKDGLYLRNLLSRRTSGKKREFYCGLPRLPSEAEKSRVPKVNFTPKAKRIRYEMCSTEDKRNDSAYYYGNYPVLLEEENVNQQVIDLFLTGSSSMKISNLLN